jgi:DNA-binding LacI/PurR family transcriptional regulator
VATPTRVTIHDVARAAGVSPTTVSHALSGKGHVAAHTRARISHAATELGYIPDPTASSLRSGLTSVLGLMLPTSIVEPTSSEILDIEWFMRLSQSAARATFGHDHSLLLISVPADRIETAAFAVDGVMVADPVADDPRIAAVKKRRSPIVTLGRVPGGDPAIPSVSYDTAGAMNQILDHLEARGARRIALLSLALSWGYVQEEAGVYRAWCDKRGVDPVPLTVEAGGIERPGELAQRAEDVTLAALRAPGRPDAILSNVEGLAVGALRAARAAGLGIPDDVLLAENSETAQARAADPPLTTVELYPEKHATAAVEMLLDLVAGGSADSVVIPHKLRCRASTAR